MRRYTHELRTCAPYPFSNDEWDAGNSAALFDMLRAQTTPEENAAALVIGAGGMPYLLGRLGISRLVLVDRDAGVPKIVARNIATLQTQNSWNDYFGAVRSGPMTAQQAVGLTLEKRRAFVLLAGNYGYTKERASRLTVSQHIGDIIELAGKIGDNLRTDGKQLVKVTIAFHGTVASKNTLCTSAYGVHPSGTRDRIVRL